VDIINKYDLVVDATDNAMARYLLSDVCVLTKKPLVSGSALRFEGQLTVYNYDEESPCYRCLFPNPPPPGTVTNCNDGGVLGVVPGIIGNLQALEVIKIAIGQKPSFAGKMLLFDGLRGDFKSVKIRGKKKGCISCGPEATIGRDLMDYEKFVGVQTCAGPGLQILAPEERVQGRDYKEQVLEKGIPHVLIDVRPKLQADITKLDNAVNIPLEELQKPGGIQRVKELLEESGSTTIYVMCRRGNASQRGVKLLKEAFGHEKGHHVQDIVGGIEAWSQQVDPNIPMY
jgi:adenylyltransferase/sulfurtransferase